MIFLGAVSEINFRYIPENIVSQGMNMISIIIPVYNEEDNIDTLCDMLFSTIIQLEDETEVICVDDGSKDGSLAKLKEAAESYPLTIIELSRNYGQTAAIMAGMDHCRGDKIVFMDADCQNDPADIPKLLEKLDEGFDVVSGWRKNRLDAKLTRNLPSQIANRLISWVSGVQLHDTGCTLKVYRKSTIKDLRLYGEMHRLIPVYAAQEGARITELPVRHHPRYAGVSKYGMGRVFKIIMDLFVSQFFARYRTRPMYVFGGVATAILALALLSGFYAVYLKLFEDLSFIQTPLPLLTISLISLSMICFLIGFLSELLMRTYFESQDRKPYAVRSVQSTSQKTRSRG